MSFLDADYSAIEARITCWLAGQEDALQEYRLQDAATTAEEKFVRCRYRIQAASIYNRPVLSLENHPHRFVGKFTVLGCGFGMGPTKYRASIEKFYKLPEGLEFKAVSSWRAKHKKVVSYWYDVERAAKNAILHKGKVFEVRERIKFMVRDVEGMPFLLMRLPSGRKLAYPKPRLCGDRIAFFGNTVGANWGDVSTWGGKLVENCLSGDTEVLSQQRGWVQLHSVTTADRLWDGEEFVNHEGLIHQGVQPVQEFHGLYATPEHKFLTVNNTWISVQTACTYPHIKLYSPDETESVSPKTLATTGHFRQQVREHGSSEDAANDSEENLLAVQMRLRERSGEAGLGSPSQESSSDGLRETMSNHPSRDREESHDSWAEQILWIPRMEGNERQMPVADASSVAQLRWSRDFCMRTLGFLFREFLGGHGANVSGGVRHRPGGQQRELYSTELPLGNTETQQQEQEKHSSGLSSRFLGHRSGKGHQEEHAVLPYQSRAKLGADHQHPARFSEQVYDIRNCGPRQRFAVRGRTGHVLIAHNCVQAVAADIMANGAHRAEANGFEIATLIHDEAISFHHEGQTAEQFVEHLTDLPSWAVGLPLEAEGEVIPFYRKS